METKVIEQYLKTILSLSEGRKPVKTTDLAKALSLAPASVTESLQKLAQERYVRYEAYRGTRLTSKGRAIASKVSRKHRLLERFLTDVLGLDPSRVHPQACAMEHSLSDEAEVALCRMLNHPDTCPDDEKQIPPCNLDVESCVECKKIEISSKSMDEHSGLKPLTQLRKGEKARVHFIRGGKTDLTRLHHLGVTKDAEVQMMNSSMFSGPVEVCVRGCKLCLGRDVANRIFVEH